MRKIFTSKLKGNEILAKPIYDCQGRTLLNKGAPIHLSYIGKLEKQGIYSMYIHDDLSEGVNVQDFISDKTRQTAKIRVRETMKKYINKEAVSLSSLTKSIIEIIEDILSQKDIIVNMTDIRTKDESLYAHSVNVCALSVMLGTHLGFNMIRLKELAIGAMLHDIGKKTLEKHIAGNPGLAGEDIEKLKEHPKIGYEYLKKSHEVSSVSRAIVLTHHENLNGTGYPFGLYEEHIHQTARVVSICNTFDRLTSDDGSRKAMKVYEAVEYLTAMSNNIFDEHIVKTFIRNIAVFPSGTGVILNTGEKAIVLSQNKSFPTRPVIRLIFDKKDNKIEEFVEIDLLQKNTLFICSEIEL